jgi:hypothetical protein
MRSLRSLIDPGGRSLAFHLDRLRRTLDELGGRLRSSLAAAVSQTAANVVRDAIEALLVSAAAPIRPVLRQRYDTQRSSWDDFDDRYDYDPEDYLPGDDPYDPLPPRRSQTPAAPQAPRQARWSQAAAAGLQAAAWWLQGRPGRLSCLIALVIGSGAAVAFLAGGSLTATGITVVLSVLSVTSLQVLPPATESRPPTYRSY